MNVRHKIKSGTLNQKEADRVKSNALEFINSLVEYGQRSDLIAAEKGVMHIRYQNRRAELVLMNNMSFLIEGKDIKKLVQGKLVPSTKEEFDKSFQKIRVSCIRKFLRMYS